MDCKGMPLFWAPILIFSFEKSLAEETFYLRVASVGPIVNWLGDGDDHA